MTSRSLKSKANGPNHGFENRLNKNNAPAFLDISAASPTFDPETLRKSKQIVRKSKKNAEPRSEIRHVWHGMFPFLHVPFARQEVEVVDRIASSIARSILESRIASLQNEGKRSFVVLGLLRIVEELRLLGCLL